VRFRSSLIFVHLVLGLAIIPFGLGHLDINDFMVRLPAIAVVAMDACVALQIAAVYTSSVYPYREYFPEWVRVHGLFRPWLAWLAAAGYYSMCLWVVIAVIATPDAPVDLTIGAFFIGGYAAVGAYKIGKLRLITSIAHTLRARYGE
jgi:hypothetical protein